MTVAWYDVPIHPTSEPSETTHVIVSGTSALNLSPTEQRSRLAENINKVRADLWSAVWEASQFLSYDQIREVVEGTINEIEVDRP